MEPSAPPRSQMGTINTTNMKDTSVALVQLPVPSPEGSELWFGEHDNVGPLVLTSERTLAIYVKPRPPRAPVPDIDR
eukprot:726245-Karenia_brevis.AAC.1